MSSKMRPRRPSRRPTGSCEIWFAGASAIPAPPTARPSWPNTRADPESYEKGLGKKLAEADAGTDEALLGAANALLELLDQQGGKPGKYSVTVTGSQGVQVGDHGTQTNTFTSGPQGSA